MVYCFISPRGRDYITYFAIKSLSCGWVCVEDTVDCLGAGRSNIGIIMSVCVR